MTENKRFKKISVCGDWGIKDVQNDKVLFFATTDEVNDTFEVLNELNNENDVLKQQLKTKYIVNKQYEELQKVKEENEQLKQFQDSVFSWIDMHLQRLPTLRDDEFESDNEFADPSLYSGAIQILETMKRELKGDVE